MIWWVFIRVYKLRRFGVADLSGVDFCRESRRLFLSGEFCSFPSEGTARLEDGVLKQRITSLLIYVYTYPAHVLGERSEPIYGIK